VVLLARLELLALQELPAPRVPLDPRVLLVLKEPLAQPVLLRLSQLGLSRLALPGQTQAFQTVALQVLLFLTSPSRKARLVLRVLLVRKARLVQPARRVLKAQQAASRLAPSPR
tara:strand:- start:290 stop:631 length:342 start_codon:yes stop_codon:yes gene_type:complete